MRIVVWNCAGGFAKKAGSLARLSPDIAIVSEITRRDYMAFDQSSALWAGASNQRGKGLALIGFNGWQLDGGQVEDSQFVLSSTARRGGEKIKIIGVWSKKVSNSYVSHIAECIEGNSSFASQNLIIAGDFNANPVFDSGRRPEKSFARIVNYLSDLEIKSIWHEVSGDEHGQEGEGTLFWMWKEDRKYHIDYVFASAPVRFCVKSVKLGTYGEWVEKRISDHVPVIVDIDDGKLFA